MDASKSTTKQKENIFSNITNIGLLTTYAGRQ